MKTLRCATYTRKSSEEGLDQSFNSLDAQREACASYVASQAGEGWTLMPGSHDDGGYSGGSMDRPGLQALLTAIRRGEVDIVVVYKVDRLTRSLADFARIVELFDEHGVSFVSVTQAFNTTTSMGRLTLNVLLSFAQFEREVTGERIRDKIAASKAKGMWMGGRPPLGYDVADRTLVVNAAEAEVVQGIFQRYLELGTVTVLTVELREQGTRSKSWTNRRGEPAGGAVLTRGALYHLLSNPIYRGAIRHRDLVYDGQHEAIIDRDIWDRTQARLAANGNGATDSADAIVVRPLLQGKLFDDRGHRMGPVHTQRRGRRYRYYASAALKPASGLQAGSLPRIAVGVLDAFVVERLVPLLDQSWKPDRPANERLEGALLKVTVGARRTEMMLASAVCRDLEGTDGLEVTRVDEGVLIVVQARLKHRQGAFVLEAPGGRAQTSAPDRALIRAVTLARSWTDQLGRGDVRSIKVLAREAGLCEHYVARLLPLAFLAPELTAEILEGRQGPAVSVAALIRDPLPLGWEGQRRLFETLGQRVAT